MAGRSMGQINGCPLYGKIWQSPEHDHADDLDAASTRISPGYTGQPISTSVADRILPAPQKINQGLDLSISQWPPGRE
jgi:hypothetical protein